jgi:hypothetical protein
MDGASERRDAKDGGRDSAPETDVPTSGNRGMVIWVLLTIAVTVLAALYIEWDFRDEIVRPEIPIKALR